jgi:hypothetical protein
MPPETEAFRPSFEQGTTTNPLFHPGARAHPPPCRGAGAALRWAMTR